MNVSLEHAAGLKVLVLLQQGCPFGGVASAAPTDVAVHHLPGPGLQGQHPEVQEPNLRPRQNKGEKDEGHIEGEDLEPRPLKAINETEIRLIR